MLRGAWFGRKSAPSSSKRRKTPTATTKVARPDPSRSGGEVDVSIYHARPRSSAPSSTVAHGEAARADRTARSPPASPVPLSPVPRMLRLFPDYDLHTEGEDSFDKRGATLSQSEQHGHQQQQQQYDPRLVHPHPDQQQWAVAKKPEPVEAEVKLPDGQKGLENNKGEYNCFINVVIQALWHLTAFRERFDSGILDQHQCTGEESCVHCALQSIFVQYQFSERCIIPPTSLRKALAVLYKDESRFQLNEIDDAAEALEAVLNKLHYCHRCHKDQHADASLLDKKNCPCLVHNTFGVRTMDLLRCETCAATTEPSATSLFMAYAYTYALRETREKAGAGEHLSLCQLISKSSQQDRRWCPNAERCNKMCIVEHHLLYLPKVFTVGLVWTSPQGAPKKEIEEVLDMITMEIDLSNIFITNTAIARYLHAEKEKEQAHVDGLPSKNRDKDMASSLMSSGVLDCLIESHDEPDTGAKRIKRKVKCIYELRGMICYYGQHYSCYFNSPLTKQWYVFDDVTVKAVGTEWSVVKERCLRGHLQPSVLFYEKKEIIEEDEEYSDPQSTLDQTPAFIPADQMSTVNEEAKPTQPLPAWDGEEALKQTMAAEILEMLMAGEDDWKKEKERERELVKVREAEEKMRIELEEQEWKETEILEQTHNAEDEEPVKTEEVADKEVEGEQLNGSWFIRPSPQQDTEQQHLEPESDVFIEEDTVPDRTELIEQDILPIATSQPHTQTEDSDWEIIGNEKNEHANGEDDGVEVIFEDTSTCQAQCTRAKVKPLEQEEISHTSDHDDVEIVDGDDERGGYHSKLRRRTSSFTILGTSAERDGLDTSFTMISDHGSAANDHVDVEVTQTSWLYRSYTKLYRLTREELLHIDPNTQAVKESFRYDEISQILLYGSLAMVLRMNADSGKTCGYIDGNGAERIAELVCARNPEIVLKRE